MNRSKLVVMDGDRCSDKQGRCHGGAEQAVRHAIRAGFRVGRAVRIGRVSGRVVGYNIGARGRFSGACYPLVVETALGIAKCSEAELTAA